MSLLESDVKEYQIKWKVIASDICLEEGIKGNIQNHDGLDIGKFKIGNGIFSKGQFFIFDANYNLVIKDTLKSILSNEEYLTDSQGNDFGIMKTKGLRNRSCICLNMREEEILVAKVESSERTGKIIDTLDKIIAQFSIAHEEIKRGYFREPLIKITCNLKILDESYDRKFLLGFIFFILINHFPRPQASGGGGG